MAQKRMFSKIITESDQFLDMSLSTQALYFHLGMQADDEGFVSPTRIMRMIGAQIDELKVLISKNFIIPFENGVVVIRHWKLNNIIQKDRRKDTIYLHELSNLSQDNSGVYNMDTKCIQDVSVDKIRLGKVSIDKDSKDKTSTIVEEAEPKFGNEDINWVIQEFETIMGFKSSGTKDRFMAKHLLNNFSKEQLTAMLKYLSTQEYAPRVGSVEKLWYKRGDIIAGIKSIKNSNKIIKSL